MQTIDIRFANLEDAARALVAAAPARGDYWGVPMRARYATTRPGDVVAQYRRTVRESAWGYGGKLPAKQRARLRCDRCGATGCKLWREYQTVCADIYCGPCALLNQGKEGVLDADGKREDKHGKSDQIGWLVPAVPDLEGQGFWGYTSVPAAACEWWRTLPTYPAGVKVSGE